MTATRTATRVESPEGTIRVYVPGADDSEGRQLARRLAQQTHGFGSIGKTPAPVKAQRGQTYTFTPVTVVREAAKPASRKGRKSSPARTGTDILASLSEREVAELRALLTGEPIGDAPKVTRVFAPVEAAKVRRATETCATCHDWGVVRARGEHAGRAYKTEAGAQAATANGNSVPCTAKVHGKSRKSA